MNRSLAALLLAPLALVIACGGDDGSGDGALFQSYGGDGGRKARAPFDGSDDDEAPIVDGEGGKASNAKAGGAGKGGASSQGGAAGKGGATGKGGSNATGGSAGTGGATSKGGSAGTGGATSKGGSSGTGGSTSKGGTGGASSSGGTGGTSSKGGSGGTGGSTSKGGTGGSGGSTSKGGTGGSGGSSSKGGTGGSASPYEDAIVPSTCEETHGSVGCCGPDNRAYYIEDDGSLAITTCTNGKVCGWRADTQWYSCVDAANEDPSGVYPLVCGGAPVAGACETGASGSGGTGGTGGAGGTTSTPQPGSEWTKCTYAWDCLSGLVCSAGYCQKPTGTGAGSNGGSSCQAKGGYGGLGCTGQFVLGCQQIGCGCCESGGIGQCC